MNLFRCEHVWVKHHRLLLPGNLQQHLSLQPWVEALGLNIPGPKSSDFLLSLALRWSTTSCPVWFNGIPWRPGARADAKCVTACMNAAAGGRIALEVDSLEGIHVRGSIGAALGRASQEDPEHRQAIGHWRRGMLLYGFKYLITTYVRKTCISIDN